MTNYAVKKELKHATGIDISDLAVKKDFMASNAEVYKLDIKELVKVPTGLNNLKAKVDNSNVAKLKTVHVDLKNVK